jgi:hypothetical protein
MLWSETRDLYLESVDALTPIVVEIEDLTAPGLGVWDVRGLAGHLLRALRTPVTYLAEPEPETDEVLDAPGYYVAYLDWRSANPAVSDDAIATRGAFELQDATALAVGEAFRQATWDLKLALATTDGDRVVATPTGAITIDAYLQTRMVEVVTHGMDLSRATGQVWEPSQHAVAAVLAILGAVAVRRGTGFDLLAVMTGREPQGDPLPVLE